MGLTANLVPNQATPQTNGEGDLIVHLTDQSFNDQTKSGYFFVDFWAEWCTPCRAIAPIVENLSREWKDKVTFAKLDIDANPLTTNRFGVMSIPSLILFKDGQPIDSMLGAQPKPMFDQFLRKNIQADDSETQSAA